MWAPDTAPREGVARERPSASPHGCSDRPEPWRQDRRVGFCDTYRVNLRAHPDVSRAMASSRKFVTQVTDRTKPGRQRCGPRQLIHRRGPVARAPYGLGAWGHAPATTFRSAAHQAQSTECISEPAALNFRFPAFKKCRRIVAANRRSGGKPSAVAGARAWVASLIRATWWPPRSRSQRRC